MAVRNPKLDKIEIDLDSLKAAVLELQSLSPNQLKALNDANSGAKIAVFKSGQSNWEGVSQHAGNFTGTPPSETFWWSGASFVPLVPGQNGYRPQNNPTVYFAKAFRETYPNLALYVIEDGQGGTGFKAGTGGFAEGGAVRSRVLNTFQSGYDAFKTLEGDRYILSFDFNQGSADGGSAEHSGAYRSQLLAFLDDVKAIVGTGVKVALTLVNDDSVGGFIDAIRDVHKTAADAFVDVDDQPLVDNVFHYDAAGYQVLGSRQFAAVQGFPLVKLAGSTSPPAPPAAPPAPGESVSFAGISALPAGWTLTNANPEFQSDRMVVSRTGNAGWGISYLTGPQTTSKRIVIDTVGTTQLGAIGLTTDPVTWLSGGTIDTLAVTTGGTVFLNDQRIVEGTGSQVNGRPMRFIFEQVGTETVVTMQDDRGSGLATYATATAQVQLNEPRVLIDSAYGNLNVVGVQTGAAPSRLSNLAAGTEVAVIWSGQSNFYGSPVTNSYDGAAPAKARFWDNGSSSFRPLIPGQNGYRSQHSPTIHFVMEFERRYPDLRLNVIEGGVNGGGFANNVYNPGDPGYVNLKANVTRGLAALEAVAPDFKLWAFIWNQGEADISRNAGTVYQTKLPAFFSDVRTWTGSALKIITTRIHKDVPYDAAEITKVRNTLESEGNAFINLDDLTLHPDGIHYNPPEYVEIAARHFAKAETFDPYNFEEPTPQTLDIDFTKISALPDGWRTRVTAAVSFNAEGMKVRDTGSNKNYAKTCVEGPAVDFSRPLEMFFKTPPTNEYSIGCSLDAINWLDRHGYDSLFVTRRAVYIDGAGTDVPSTRTAGFVGGFTDLGQNTRAKLIFTKIGNNIRAQVFKLNGTNYDQIFDKTIPDFADDLAGAKIAIDPQSGDGIKVERVVN